MFFKSSCILIDNYCLYFNQGKCIGKGTYDHLLASGVDFMSLLQVSSDPDSAVETDYEEDDGRSRSFSRQESAMDDSRSKLSPKVLRKNSSVVRERSSSTPTVRRRKESILSFKDPDTIGSDLSVASKSGRVKVFVSSITRSFFFTI